MGDWFNAPEIKALDAAAWSGGAGEVIRVCALDDVKVDKVSVVITAPDGTVVEQGEAEQIDELWWHYTTTSPAGQGARLLVKAQDLPGHVTEMTWD